MITVIPADGLPTGGLPMTALLSRYVSPGTFVMAGDDLAVVESCVLRYKGVFEEWRAVLRAPREDELLVYEVMVL